MLTGYLRLIVFSIGLLVGVQVPGFVDQYVKRVSAHQSEALRNFSGFQQTADQYFGGDVGALIAHHEASADPAFKSEAQNIRNLYARLTALSAELAALRVPLVRQILHVILHPDPQILDETRAEYSYTVPLSPSAIACGVAIGALLALLAETALLVCLSPFRSRPMRLRAS
jgi:uncharacterized membrane-anchored protein YhcB (DUF1043 family)